MNKLIALFLVSFLMLQSASFADPISHKKVAEELLIVTNVKGQLDQMLDQMRAMQAQQLRTLGQSEDAITNQNEMMQYVEEMMGWETLKDDYISLYIEVFSEEELQGLVDFYKSDLGQKLLVKQPELMKRSMEIGQKHSMKVLEKLRSSMAENDFSN